MAGSSRRQFLALALTASAAEAQTARRKLPVLAPILGLCSTSLALRDPSVDKLIEAVRPLKLPVISLGTPHFDPWSGNGNRLAEMRAIREKFTAASILVRSVSIDIEPQRTDPEITRMLVMANALDVRHVVASAPVAMLGRLNDLARKQGMLIALVNGGRSEIDSVSGFQSAVHSFGSLGIALNASNLEAKGGDPVELLNHNGSRLFEVRFRPAGARTTEALSTIRYRFPNIPMFIDVPAPTGIAPSVEYFRTAIRQKPPEQPGVPKGSSSTKKKE